MASKKKKAAEEERKVLLGRPGNNVKIGIVGLPNVGKSSMFNLLSKLNVPAENYPFCTIDPNVANIPVPDQRFKWLCEKYRPASEVAPVITVKDIAGLVRGAHEGQGLGNAFLSHIREVDAIYHLVRAFENAEVTHVEESVDPVRDLRIITHELVLKDLEQVENTLEGLERVVARGIGGKEKKFEFVSASCSPTLTTAVSC
jgi:obg-like ATPase 1